MADAKGRRSRRGAWESRDAWSACITANTRCSLEYGPFSLVTAMGLRFRRSTLLGCVGLCLICLVATGTWFWLSMPRIMAQRFVNFLVVDDLVGASEMLGEPIPRGFRGAFRTAEPEWRTRTVAELVLGQQRFRVPFEMGDGDHEFSGVIEFTASLGDVSGGHLASDSP